MRAVIVVVDGVLSDEYDAFRAVLDRLHGVEVDTVGAHRGRFSGPGGSVVATHAYDEVDATDILAVPGSLGCRRAAEDHASRAVLQRLAASSSHVVASSTGSVMLAAAGVVHHESVATHWLAGELIGEYGCSAASTGMVATGKTITCSGALTALDAALIVADRVDGDGTSARVRRELLTAGQHLLRPAPWWRSWLPARRTARSAVAPGAAQPPPTPRSVMIELVDDPELVERLRRTAKRRRH